MKVVTESQMREMDRVAIQERGVPSLALMERAGQAVANLVAERYRPRRVAICAGKGNNAGDGFVAARILSQRGVAVDLFLAAPPDELRGDAQINFSALPAKVRHFRDLEADHLRSLGPEADAVVDALLGTGIKGQVTGSFATMIEAINALGRPVVAVDVPSGLSPENLEARGPCVRADVTVTLGFPKLSLVTYPGVSFVGELVVADIGLPADLPETFGIRLNLLGAEEVRALVPGRPPDGHKGTFGHLLVVAGAFGMGGAAAMVGQAALRSGVGLVTVATHEKNLPGIEAHLLSALKKPLTSKKRWVLDLTAFDQLEPVLDGFDAVALGPGLGQDPATQRLILALIDRIRSPLVLDADGLNALAKEPDRIAARAAPTVLTPHPKEMERISGRPVGEIQTDRVGAAQACAERWGVTVVLKGARTVIAAPTGEAWINPTGNSGLAKGGSGDLLTGLIGGLLAQGLAPTAAALLGVYWHGLAADVVARSHPQQVMIPDDVAGALGEALRQLVG